MRTGANGSSSKAARRSGEPQRPKRGKMPRCAAPVPDAKYPAHRPGGVITEVMAKAMRPAWDLILSLVARPLPPQPERPEKAARCWLNGATAPDCRRCSARTLTIDLKGGERGG